MKIGKRPGEKEKSPAFQAKLALVGTGSRWPLPKGVVDEDPEAAFLGPFEESTKFQRLPAEPEPAARGGATAGQAGSANNRNDYKMFCGV